MTEDRSRKEREQDAMRLRDAFNRMGVGHDLGAVLLAHLECIVMLVRDQPAPDEIRVGAIRALLIAADKLKSIGMKD